MTSSKQLSRVALFPLCDARGVLMDALRDASGTPATRGDALVFAWRLELPEGMNVGHAADAVLKSALSIPRSAWTRQQLLIIRELMVLAGREEPLPNLPTSSGPVPNMRTLPTMTKAKRLRRTASRNAVRPAPDSQASARASVDKQDKDWWKLVGREDSSDINRQRKTRKERVSREPT